MEGKAIYQKMVDILKETNAISKSEKNQQQGFKFRGIDNVMNKLHDIFQKNDVFILSEVLSFTTTDRPTKSGSMNTFTRATIKFKYVTTDGSFVETINVGEAMDLADKGMNKAMSTALKYSLLQMFLIPTEDQKDPDAITPEETDYLGMALQEINGAQSNQTLVEIYNNYKSLQGNNTFMGELSKKKSLLKNAV